MTIVTRSTLLSIGQVSARTGLAVSAIRFYESRGLVSSTRNAGGQRRFERSTIRRLSFILIAQQLGFTLEEVGGYLGSLPDNRTPTKADWDRMGREFKFAINTRIEALEHMRDTLTGCIGCGCLSLRSCALYNPGDRAAGLGAGPRYLLGDQA